jgi:hypothetical protein
MKDRLEVAAVGNRELCGRTVIVGLGLFWHPPISLNAPGKMVDGIAGREDHGPSRREGQADQPLS